MRDRFRNLVWPATGSHAQRVRSSPNNKITVRASLGHHSPLKQPVPLENGSRRRRSSGLRRWVTGNGSTTQDCKTRRLVDARTFVALTRIQTRSKQRLGTTRTGQSIHGPWIATGMNLKLCAQAHDRGHGLGFWEIITLGRSWG